MKFNNEHYVVGRLMTALGLLVVQVELEHFERRINKHEFFEKQAERSRATLQMKKKYEEHELPESHVQLESKVQFLGAKVSPGHQLHVVA